MPLPNYLTNLTLKVDETTAGSRLSTPGEGSLNVRADASLYLQTPDLYITDWVANDSSFKLLSTFFSEAATAAENFTTDAISVHNNTIRDFIDASILTSYDTLTSETAALIATARQEAIFEAQVSADQAIANNNVTERAATDADIESAVNIASSTLTVELQALQARIQAAEDLLNAMNA